jgi:hypothetical protein
MRDRSRIVSLSAPKRTRDAHLMRTRHTVSGYTTAPHERINGTSVGIDPSPDVLSLAVN